MSGRNWDRVRRERAGSTSLTPGGVPLDRYEPAGAELEAKPRRPLVDVQVDGGGVRAVRLVAVATFEDGKALAVGIAKRGGRVVLLQRRRPDWEWELNPFIADVLAAHAVGLLDYVWPSQED